MPELPEVETVCRVLRAGLVGAEVRSVTLRRADIVTGRAGRADLLAGATVTGVRRRGKSFALVARAGERDRLLGVHLGMTGQMLLLPKGTRPPTRALDPHTHAVWRLGGDKGWLVFRDPRRFGGLWTFGSSAELDRHWESLGPDALSDGAAGALERARASRSPIKARLLDQRLVAGIGNIYADEALFEAKLSPLRVAATLTDREVAALAGAVRSVLTKAVEARGSTLRDYRDPLGEAGGFVASHRVYGRAGLACVECGRTLASGTVGQRTTVWCPRCQR